PAGEGTLMTFSPDPSKNEAAKPVVDALNAANQPVEGYTLYTYAAIQAWAEAVKAAGSTEFEAVTKALDEGQFNTVLGNLEFDDKGDVTLPGYVFYEWKNGTYETISQ
ncbi:MAG TPA: ABC transporter substrate-binding protein, partial [Tianweitania sediminis]|nr:ABC transporter substrate-binding protein [Tianweitania sediminis]